MQGNWFSGVQEKAQMKANNTHNLHLQHICFCALINIRKFQAMVFKSF